MIVSGGIVGNSGGPYKTLRGAMDVHNADVHQAIVNKYFHQHTGVSTTLTAAIPGDGTAYEIEVADATGFIVGRPLHLNTGSVEITHPILRSTTAATGPAVFTLDRRLDIAHEIGDVVEMSLINMATLNGTIAAPQEYWVGPEAGEVWHLTRILFEMQHDAGGDLAKFGGIPALANGCILRARLNGTYFTFTNWKRNGDIKADMYDVDFDSRAGGASLFGTTGRGTFTRAGSIIRLDGDTGDRLELYVQDTLVGLGLNTFTMKAQGHPEDR